MIAIIYAISVAVATRSLYVSGIRVDIDVRGKPTGVIIMVLLPPKTLRELSILDISFSINTSTMQN